MTARLPTIGGDDNDWGTILNTFLLASHNADGTLSTAAVTTALPSPIPTANLGSGTASSSNFLRGDGTWAVPSGGGGVTLDTTATDIQPDTVTGSAVAGSTGKAADAGHQHTLVSHDHSTTNKGGNIPESSVTNLTTDLAAKAPLVSPALTGTPTAPTATAGTNTTQVATTAFVSSAVSGVASTSSSSTQTFTGNVSAPAIIAAGLTGATAASRYVGATSSGSPASGTFAKGDFIIDQTGLIWICTTAGSPGTWTKGSIALDNTASDIQALGSRAAGSTGKAADAGHVHPTTGLALLSGASFTGGVNPSVVTLTYGGTISVNAANGNDFRITLAGSGATIATPTNPTDGQRITFQITQDSTGSRTVTWQAGGYNFGTGGTPTLSTAANLTDVIGFIYNATIDQWLAAGAALGF